MLTVRYFARLRENLGVETEQIPVPAGVRDVAGLSLALRERGGAFAAELAHGRPVRIAVNQHMANPDTAVADGDEIAFFPPVTGG